MYSQFFGLRKNPFSQLIQSKNIRLPESHQFVYEQLVDCVAHSTGVVCLLGAIGVGKTTLITRLVAEHLNNRRNIDFRDFFAVDCLVPSTSACDDLSAIIKSIERDGESIAPAATVAGGQRKTVYLLDVGKAASSALLANLFKQIIARNTNNDATLLILVGHTDLKQQLSGIPHLLGKNPFRRICYLNVLNETEAIQYINQRIQAVRVSDAPLFTKAAIRAIISITGGIPRYINTLSGMSLYQAELEKLSVVTESKVLESSQSCFFEDDDLRDLELTPTSQSENNQPFTQIEEHSQLVAENSVQVDTVSLPGQTDSADADKSFPVTASAEFEQIELKETAKDSPKKRKPEKPFMERFGFAAAGIAVCAVIVVYIQRVPDPVGVITVSEKADESEEPELWLYTADALVDSQSRLAKNSADSSAANAAVSTVTEMHAAAIASRATSLVRQEEPQSDGIVFSSRKPGDDIASLLTKAETLEANNRLTLPPDDNALATYQRIRDIDPDNVEAGRGIERIKDRLIKLARESMAQSHWSQARSNLQKVQRIDPDNETVAAMFAGITLQQKTLTETESKYEFESESESAVSLDQQEQAAKSRATARYQLSQQGVDFDLPNFFLHVKQGHTHLVALFLDANIPIDAQENVSGDTALIKAVTYGHVDTAQLLLSRQGNVNIQNRIGRTALMNAIIFGQYDLALTLIDRSVDVEIKDRNGWTALMFANQKNQSAIINELINKGAKINGPSNDGQANDDQT